MSNRGSTWNKWDIHVHTPLSIMNSNYGGDTEEAWESFISDLEALPSEFKVIGINDYIFIDGYKKVLHYKKTKGRLQNIERIFPVIELRLDKFGGAADKFSKVNFHIIFSDELKPETIESQFLQALQHKYQLSPEAAAEQEVVWDGTLTRESLIELGEKLTETTIESQRHALPTPLKLGFSNLCTRHNEVQTLLEKDYFKNKYITAIGKTEWADIKWTGQGIAEKKHIINSANLVFISAESVKNYQKARQTLTTAGVNDKLIDCSDAHSFSSSAEKERIGKCFTWIKADTTFDGLKQAILEFEERVYVGDKPQKLLDVEQNSTKYLCNIKIKKLNSTLTEDWFDCDIDVNPGLVAIIGNKGNGKSALLDVLALLGNTKQSKSFSFLNKSKFKDPKNNKALHFEGTSTWFDESSYVMRLDDDIDKDEVELVRYIPQNFLEELCNEINTNKESVFDNELENVIFSHVEKADRLGCTTLRELEEYKTNEIKKKIEMLKLELNNINEEIISYEGQTTDAFKTRIKNELKQKWKELKAHRTAIPKEVLKPSVNSDSAESQAITTLKEKLDLVENTIKEKCASLELTTKVISVLEKVKSKIDNIERSIGQTKLDIAKDLGSVNLLEIDTDTLLQAKFNREPLDKKLEEYQKQKSLLDIELETFEEEEEDVLGLSFYSQKQDILVSIKEAQDKLDEPNRKYQKYLSALEEWQKKRESLIGSETIEGSIVYLRHKLAVIRNLEPLINESRQGRLEKASEIYREVAKISNIHSFLYKPIQDFINDESLPIDKEKFKLNFEVSIVESGLHERFFDIIKQNVRGTFAGKSEGRVILHQIIEQYDFNSEEEVLQFIGEIEEAITHDLRSDHSKEKVSVEAQLKDKKTKLNLYNLLYSLDYLKPKYELKLGSKSLKQLSPGEKGTLLLVFYLLLDKDDIPLLIDQPEDNLDNQTVYELLVPSVKEVKKRRQIFIVTHNPNLAVVCDAEQVIHTEIDKVNKCKVIYTIGAIENPTVNQKILDVLEGTKPAFDNRKSKYQVALR